MPRASRTTQTEASGPVTITVQQPGPSAPPEKEKREELDFWSYLRALTPQQWRDHSVYLYRTRPVVGLNQREKYLAVYQQPFTIEDVKKTYGGEEFRAILNSDGHILKQISFGVEAAPIYDTSRETPGRAEERSAAAERIADKMIDRMDPRQVISNTTDMLMQAHRASLEMVKTPAENGGGGEAIKLMIAMMQSQTQIITTLITAALRDRAPETAAANDPMKQLDIFMGLFDKMKDFAGGGGKTSVWETLAQTAVEKAPEIIKSVQSGVREIGSQRIALEQARRGEMPIVPPSAPPAAPAAIPAQGVPPQAPPPVMPQITEDEAFEKLGTRHLVKMIYNGEDVDTIMEFLRGMNREMYNAVLDLDANGLRMVLGADQILAQALQYPQLEELIAAIVEYSAEVKAEILEEPEQARVQ